MSYRVGIDVGGTFTDLFLEIEGGEAQTFKVLSTPADSSEGVLEGMGRMAESQGLSLEDFARDTRLIVHGTTVTTNAVLTRGGAATGLLTTEGVRDALEMRRGVRERQYDNRYQNVVPLVPRWLRLPVVGRLGPCGDEITPLDAAGVRDAALKLRAAGVESVAICFMHSYANADHEQAAARVVREELPEAFLSISSEVLPTVRFYERVSTTALGAYVGPVLADYLSNLTGKLRGIGFCGVLLIMQSNGGVALPEVTAAQPAGTLLSGPAAGPRAAAAFAQEHQHEDCILVDMGGTSFDASLVRGGVAALSMEGQIDRLRNALPMLEITTIGAGGGSIGWIDEGGLLRMGPQSAGASPGPACYGRGGVHPTCTDADLWLGYLDPDYFAGGKLRLDVECAARSIGAEIAAPLGMELEDAAAGMYRVINANMATGVREITVKRGLDPREFVLVVAGGAGPLHACMIASELEIPTLLVPSTASILCATGMLLCDLQHDYVRSCVMNLDEAALTRVRELVAELSAEGVRQLELEGAPEARHQVFLDLRYLKQYHEVSVELPRAALEAGDLDRVAGRFHAEHNRLYGYDLAAQGAQLELISVRVCSLGYTEKPALPRVESGGEDVSSALKAHRRAYVPERGQFAEIPVLDGHRLLSGNRFSGPALVERIDTTIFVSAAYQAEVDALGSILLRHGERG